MNTIILTKEGSKKLKDELYDLKNKQRPDVIERIKNARELGDLSENADYANAREQQSFIEGKILELEEKLKNAQVVDAGSTSSIVGIGHKVDLDCSGEKKSYHIVGDNESDPLSGKISVNSPIAQAIIGKKLGDSVKIKVPAGIKECKVLKIQ